MRAVLILLATFALAACASGMTKKECLYADWRAVGCEDGAAGRDAGACDGRNEAAFIASFEKGLALYDYISRLDAARAALSNAHADLERIEHEIAANEAALVSPATPHPARIDHLAALKHLHEERSKVRAATRDIAGDVDATEDDLIAFQRALAAHDGDRATRPTPTGC
jgi:hypothetical protein